MWRGDEGEAETVEAVPADDWKCCKVFLWGNRKSLKNFDMILFAFYKDYSAVGRLARRARQEGV